MGFTETLMVHITHLIEVTGYWGVGFLMALESMIAPVPSEGVMPFAGFLICDGKMTFLGVAASSTIGSIVGSMVSYVMGYFGGKPFVHWFGRFLFLNVHHLEVTENFFHRHGGKTVFISRFIPIVRHLISIPAGVGRMNLLPFAIYTIVGACMWNTFLAWCGYRLRDHWEVVHQYSGKIDIGVVAVFGAVILYFAWKHYTAFRRRNADRGETA